MFDPSTETDPDFDLDIKDEVEEECLKFGPVKHIFVDKNSKGHVYLRFDSVASAANCQRAMHGRWYARRCISAIYMRPQEYEAKFGSS
ncbi:RNA-binding protein 39-like [Ananas comosus]|nr:RNA-binding protein 39-like [Ananas comosus]